MEPEASLTDTVDASALIVQPARTTAVRSASGDLLESLLVTILLALFGTTFILQAFKIPSQSMEPTLLVGDHLLVNKFLFEGTGSWYDKLLPYRSVRRGDVIVFKFPHDDHPHYVKRVIGLPGERIRIVDDQVYVNGNPLAEPYVVHNAETRDYFGGNFPPADRGFLGFGVRPEWAAQIMDSVQNGELLVPPDHFFVMGDNRDNSSDSRYWGFVDRDAIIGRPIVIYWSVQATSQDYTDRSLLGTILNMEDTLAHLSSRTRWNRMLREVH